VPENYAFDILEVKLGRPFLVLLLNESHFAIEISMQALERAVPFLAITSLGSPD
jgi:hypothetical protein